MPPRPNAPCERYPPAAYPGGIGVRGRLLSLLFALYRPAAPPAEGLNCSPRRQLFNLKYPRRRLQPLAAWITPSL